MMNNKTLISLEFDKIKELLKKHCVTSMGIEKIEALKPSTNINEIKNMQLETSEAVSLSLRRSVFPLVPVNNLDSIIKKVSIGGVLHPGELLIICDVLRTSRRLKEYFLDSDLDISYFKALSVYFEN